jgi:hypothetical protein
VPTPGPSGRSVAFDDASFFFTIPTVEDKPKRDTGDDRVRARMARVHFRAGAVGFFDINAAH